MYRDDFTLEWAIEFIASRIRTLREAKEISAQTMSIQLGQNVSYINKIENKLAKPSIEGLYNICDYLGITFDEFFDSEVAYPDKLKELLDNAQKLDRDSLQLLIDFSRKLNERR